MKDLTQQKSFKQQKKITKDRREDFLEQTLIAFSG